MNIGGRHIEFGHGAMVLGAALPVLSDTYQAYNQGRSVPGEFVRSTFKNTWPLAVTQGMRLGVGAATVALFALPALPALVAGMHGMYLQHNQHIRQAGVPFSHRLEHSAYTSAAQMRGMQSILGTRSIIGSEAARFNERYGRR